MSANDILKDFCMDEELRTSIKLIELGFGEFQNLDMSNDFYHLPFQLLSSGFERLMKCHICLGHHDETGTYPESKFLKQCGGRGGHDLLELKSKIFNSYFKTNNIPVLKEDQYYLQNDTDLKKLVFLLSEFGKFARYYNLDIITAAIKPSIDVKSLWENYETDLIKSNPEFVDRLGDFTASEEMLNFTKRQIIIKLELFARAICRQFTIGKLGEKALIYSSILFSFIILKDQDLGNTDYRLKTVRHRKTEFKIKERTEADEIERKSNPNFHHTKINKNEFEGDWPFYHDEVVIECREKYWCVITIDNKDFALNGSAKGRYKLEFPHEAGMSIIGKSLHPFIKKALKLGEEN